MTVIESEMERRQALADFLRTRRARLKPEDVGLAQGFRRRIAGLRREEVAQLANVGVAWYTALEQGRPINPSREVVGSLAHALLLSPVEMRHLYLLANQPQPLPPPIALREEVSPAVQRIVNDLASNPAYVLGRRWDLLAWNRAAETVFNFPTITPPHSRNLLWYIFTGENRRRLYVKWDEIAHNVIGQFRASRALYPGDLDFDRLIKDLQEVSPEFRELWERHDVGGKIEGSKLIYHPWAGVLALDHTTLEIAGLNEQKVMIYTPSLLGDNEARLRDLLSLVEV